MKKLKSRTFQLLAVAVVLFGTVATTTLNTNTNYFEIAKNIEIFTNLYKEVNSGYVDELDPAQLMKTGVDAMLESLDPYTNYWAEGQIEGWRFMTEGKYNGIGADIRIIGDHPTLVAPYKDAPADKAGMKAGDRILKIDGKSTEGKTSEEIQAFIKGYPGTEVKMMIDRPGEKDEMEIVLVRDEVSIGNVPHSGMVSEDVGYVALSTFTRQAGRNIGNAIKDLKVEQPELKGVILDLRGNGGGLLAEAVNVSSLFVPKGEMVVSTRGKVKDWDRSFKTLNAPVDENVPLVVLIDKNSASASEIVSGVIQDLDRGVLIGQRSYGKGLVQNTKDIGYNSKVKLTTAKYYIPSGRCIQSIEYKNGEPVDIPDEKRTQFKTRNGRTVLDGGGVKPDIVLDPDSESEILTILEEKFIIFNYVNEWIVQNPEVTDAEAFHFNQWDEFVQYLELTKFNYDTESEKLLEKLKDSSNKKKYLSDDDIDVLENKIMEAKKNELTEYKDLIVGMIEKEIVSRYFYEKGRVQVGLRNDKEIKEALKLFDDTARYESILKGK